MTGEADLLGDHLPEGCIPQGALKHGRLLEPQTTEVFVRRA